VAQKLEGFAWQDSRYDNFYANLLILQLLGLTEIAPTLALGTWQ